MRKTVLACLVAAATLVSCKNGAEKREWTDNAVETSVCQLELAAELTEGTGRLPQCIDVEKDIEELAVQLGKDVSDLSDAIKRQPSPDKAGELVTCDIYNWTSGFFPGSLWYAYELTGDETIKDRAVRFTNLLSPVQYLTGTHDVGFMIQCSFGNAMRLSPSDTARDIIIQTAETLLKRFDPVIGCIRSWDSGDWNYPVIIDNMMNLELLFNASKLSGDPKYRDAAVVHANTTMKNHFRDDYTSFHVVSYNPDGSVEVRQTRQGRSDDSAWARGQAWGLYGYTVCFRETGDSSYLDLARNIADMIVEKVCTDDAVPFWDYSAPRSAKTPRDASAAAITASAMLELSEYAPRREDSRKYFDYAVKILQSLSSEAYLSPKGENRGFILLHSVGDMPRGIQVDTPLNYADYYYMEALTRYLNILNKK